MLPPLQIPAYNGISFAGASFSIDFWLFLKPTGSSSSGGGGKNSPSPSAKRRGRKGNDDDNGDGGDDDDDDDAHEVAMLQAAAFARQQEADEYGVEVVFSCGVRNSAVAESHSCVSVYLERGRTFMCLSLFNDDLKVLTSPEDVGKWVQWCVSFDAASKVLVIKKDGDVLGRRSAIAPVNRCVCAWGRSVSVVRCGNNEPFACAAGR